MFDSPRAGGGYVISDQAEKLIMGESPEVRTRLTTWLIDQRMQSGGRRPLITTEIVRYAKSRRPLHVYERANRLLTYFVDRKRISEIIKISLESIAGNLEPDNAQLELCRTLAWSESETAEEVIYLLDYLESQGWIAGKGINRFTVTVNGHNQVAEQKASINSSQAFVAMWFNERMVKVYEEGIEPAVMDAGYLPLRIDNKKDVNKLDDEIIAAIRESLFVIADFTHGDEGLRGSVYYEAGFAHGLGKDVIFTCQEDTIRKLHFDVRQYAFIGWKTPEDLRKGLLDRIRARVGTGPVNSGNIE